MKNLNKKVKFYDYISLSDLEVLCSHIENKETTIFNFIEQRNRYSRFLPLEHSYGINYGLIDRPEISMSNFKKSTNSVMLHLRDEQA